MAEISQTRIQECRRSAHEILHKLHVEAPDEIDLETIAWKVGRLEIQYGGVKNCDGRIIANSTGGGTRVLVDGRGLLSHMKSDILFSTPRPRSTKTMVPPSLRCGTTRARKQRQTPSQPSCSCPSFLSHLGLRKWIRVLRWWTGSLKNSPQVFWRPPSNISTAPLSRL